MKTKKNNRGFTLAEILIVVAITVVLLGVAFVGVQNYQRSSTRLEYDGIAKEIYIAAQNHLTTAQSQGYLQLGLNADGSMNYNSPAFGTKVTTGAEADKYEYYFTYNRNSSPYSADPQQPESLIDLMLPFGAIDETIRAGGSYIIHYQPSSGQVLDVFYSVPGKSSMLTLAGVQLDASDYGTLMSSYRFESNRKNRERFSNNGKTGVVGWYGGEEGLPIGTRLEDPDIVIHNEEVLWVEVTDNNAKTGSLQLIVTGTTSGAQRSFDLRDISSGSRVKNGKDAKHINVILDDITQRNFHFADLFSDNSKLFIPGENIVVEAIAYDNNALTNVGYSGKKTTNSLFAELREETAGSNKEHVMIINNFRHFENLDKNISDFKNGGVIKKQDETFEILGKARQIKDLNWTSKASSRPTSKPDVFVEAVWNINGSKPVSIFDKNNTAVTNESRFYPASPDYKLEYDGQSSGKNHKVSNVIARHSDSAGLFGSLSIAGSAVKNLELVDFEIVSTSGNAGALVGTAANTTITNVLAHNSTGFTKKENVQAAGTGSAGGLIGSMSSGTVEKSAAALWVKSDNYAGGLIGSMSGGTVTASYAGGHTENAQYSKTSFNVTGATAGGLIGGMSGGTVNYSYSTCSASGSTAGGFVGTGSGSISDCYCTGLVSGSLEGAFAGSLSTTPRSCRYFEIINDRPDTAKGFTYLSALGGNEKNENITAFDESAASYEAFCGSNWDPASPYDDRLKGYYNGKYNLQTVKKLGASVNSADFVSTHYGDWPAPEAFVVNEGSSSGNSLSNPTP